jgi:branched-subunit amino acid aminotransferase/4-amino-4-deoxychorismate lyase
VSGEIRGAPPYPCFANGRLYDADEPALPATDLGFLLGVGVFETIRVERAVPLFLEEHLARMEAGARFLALPVPRTDPAAAVNEYLARTGLQRGVVRVTRTAGAGAGSPGSVVLTARPLPEPLPEGVLLAVARHRKLAGDPFETVKSISRVRSAIAREEAAARGAFDALVRSSEGDFVEGTVSNLFAVVGGGLRTPPLGRGALAGVIRDLLLEGLPRRGVPVEERRIEEEDLRRASEVIVSNAVVGPAGVLAVLGLRTGLPGEAGEVARAARSVYREAVEGYLRGRSGASS